MNMAQIGGNYIKFLQRGDLQVFGKNGNRSNLAVSNSLFLVFWSEISRLDLVLKPGNLTFRVVARMLLDQFYGFFTTVFAIKIGPPF